MEYPNKSYYDTLGIPRTATFEQIKTAYREQIKFFHPDVFAGNPEIAQQKSRELNEAYRILSDPIERDKYDFWLRVKDYQKSYTRRKEEQHSSSGAEGQSAEQADEPTENSDPSSNGSTAEDQQEPEQEKNESNEAAKVQEESERAKRGSTYKAACIVLLLLLIGVSTFSVWNIHGLQSQQLNLESEIAELNEQITPLTEEVSTLNKRKEQLTDKVDSLNGELAEMQQKLDEKQQELDGARQELEDAHLEYNAADSFGLQMFKQLYEIGFIVNGNSYYHNFTCDIYKNADTYWAHNIEYCKGLGYSRCPQCWNLPE